MFGKILLTCVGLFIVAVLVSTINPTESTPTEKISWESTKVLVDDMPLDTNPVSFTPIKTKEPTTTKKENKITLTKPKIDIPTLERQIHDRVNEIRAENGVKQLKFDERLANIARSHSADMAERDYYSHITLEGLDPSDRGKLHGFEVCGDVDPNKYQNKAKYKFQSNRVLFDGIAENLMLLDGYENIVGASSDGWLSSLGHKQNMIRNQFSISGVGIVVEDDKYYITQNFC